MKRTTLIIASILFCATAGAQTAFDCEQIKHTIKQTRNEIDSLKENHNLVLVRDRIDSLNGVLEEQLKTLSVDDRFQNCNVSLKYDFFYLLSSDKRFAISSWDTQQGGSMIDFTNTIIYKSPNGNKLEKLQYGEKGNYDNTKIMFDTLFTVIKDNGEAIYLACGSGKFSASLPFKVIRAFIIRDSLVQDFQLFPQNETSGTTDQYQGSSLWVNYNRQKFKSADTVKDFIFIEGGQKILVPMVDENGRPSKRHYTLYFDGTKYSK